NGAVWMRRFLPLDVSCSTFMVPGLTRAGESAVFIDPEDADRAAVVMHHGKRARIRQHAQMTGCVARRLDPLPHTQSIAVDADHRDATLPRRRFIDRVSEWQTRVQHDE